MQQKPSWKPTKNDLNTKHADQMNKRHLNCGLRLADRSLESPGRWSGAIPGFGAKNMDWNPSSKHKPPPPTPPLKVFHTNTVVLINKRHPPSRIRLDELSTKTQAHPRRKRLSCYDRPGTPNNTWKMCHESWREKKKKFWRNTRHQSGRIRRAYLKNKRGLCSSQESSPLLC